MQKRKNYTAPDMEVIELSEIESGGKTISFGIGSGENDPGTE